MKLRHLILPFLFLGLSGFSGEKEVGIKNHSFSRTFNQEYHFGFGGFITVSGKPYSAEFYDFNKNDTADVFCLFEANPEKGFRGEEFATYHFEDSNEDGIFETLRGDSNGNKTLDKKFSIEMKLGEIKLE